MSIFSNSTTDSIAHSFSFKATEMGQILNQKNWIAFPVGNPSAWSQGLQTGMHTILATKFPAFIVAKQHSICFYNDAFSKYVGSDILHKDFQGKPASQVLDILWPEIEPLVNELLQSGDQINTAKINTYYFSDDKKVAAGWTFTGVLLCDGSDNCDAIIIYCKQSSTVDAGQFKTGDPEKWAADFTRAKFALAESEKKFRNMVMQSPLAMVIFRGRNFVIETVNTQMLTQVWQKQEKEVLGKTLIQAFPEIKDQKYLEILTGIFNSGGFFHDIESPVALIGANGIDTFFLEISYTALFEIDGEVSGVLVTANNITRTVEAKNRLDAAQKRFQLLTEDTGMATWDLELKTDLIKNSKEVAEIYGFPGSTELSHKEMYHYIHPDDKIIVDKAYQTALITGIYLFDARIIWPDNSIHWIRAHGKILLNENHHPFRMVGTLISTTAEKEKENYVLKLAAIVESSVDAIISTQLDGTIITFNNAAAEMLGYTAAEMIGHDCKVFFPPNQTAAEKQFLHTIYNDGGVHTIEVKAIKKDSTIFDISILISPIKDSNGNITGLLKIGRDITKQKLIEKQVISSEARFRSLANEMTQFIWTSNNEGILNYFNQAVYDFSGLSNDDLVQGGWLKFVHPDDCDNNLQLWQQAINNSSELTIEHRLRRCDGEYLWYLTRAKPQIDCEGKIKSWIGTSTDINELKLNEQNKDFFISMASHELNTPVTTIKGYVEMLIAEYANQEDAFFTDSILSVHKQILALTGLVKDLLDLSKIKTGSLSLNKTAFYVDDFIIEMINEFKLIYAEYDLQFTPINNILVVGDKVRLRQVMINFITNAIKYSPSKKTIIIVSKSNHQEVIVAVTDFGIGINKINAQKVFQRFFRVSGKNEKTYPGFGIGLFIASEIIQKHQGKIWVESELDKGSSFYFSLPL